MEDGALSGIKVLDLSRLLPGPFCSMILSDHGAEVITIEDKRYKDESGFPTFVNRNKSHMTLNLKTEEGKQIFYKMVKGADVVIEGFRPGVTKKLGVDYITLSDINPGIIYCSITGYGQTGMYKDRAGHDVNFLGMSGVLGLIGEKGKPPSIPGIQIADIAGGGMSGVIGILLALQARHNTGRGQYIDISMTDTCVSMLQLALEFHEGLGLPMEKSDSILSHRYAFYNTYETKDGRYLTLGALEPRFWKNLCLVLKKPEYISLQYDENRKDEITAFLRGTFQSKTMDEWKHTLADQDICWGPVNSISDVLEDPMLIEREMVVDVQTEVGETQKTLGIPVKLSETPGRIKSPPVVFGSSTELVLKEYGFSENEIKNLKDKSVI